MLFRSLREAIFALDAIAADIDPTRGPGVRATLAAAMQRDPSWWRGYYPDDDHLAREFSLSDRLRYYWPVPDVEAATQRLLAELAARPIPPTLVSQYLPAQYAAWRDGRGALTPGGLIDGRIAEVLERYARAASE